LWDASAQAEGWNYYTSPITVDLTPYAGMQIMLAMHAEDPPSNDGLWYDWFVDSIYIGNALAAVSFEPGTLSMMHHEQPGLHSNIPAGELRSKYLAQGGARTEKQWPVPMQSRNRQSMDRMLVGYDIYRLTSGQEGNESLWTLLTDESITNLEFVDDDWTDLPNGTYRWAIKALYTAGVISAPSLSNAVVREQLYGTVVGFVRRSNNQGIAGATVSSGEYSATTNNAGAYSLYLPAGLHDITAAAAGFTSQTVEQMNIIPNQNITLNFIMIPSANEDPVSPVLATTLKGNLPNPFNPSTTILYDILEPCEVRLDIYNTRGQKIRTLIDAPINHGHHSVVFDGKDDHGRGISSGVYFYRFKAGKYLATRKMLLME